MTKLKKAVKLAAKRRRHKKNVEKRKEQRLEKALREAQEKEAARLEAAVDHDLAEADGDDAAAAAAASKLAGFEVTAAAKMGKKKVKQLTRKQQKRLAKKKVKGEADRAVYSKKFVVKARRVYQRAVVRNTDLE